MNVERERILKQYRLIEVPTKKNGFRQVKLDQETKVREVRETGKKGRILELTQKTCVSQYFLGERHCWFVPEGARIRLVHKRKK